MGYVTDSGDFEITSTQASIVSDAINQARAAVGRIATEHRDLHSTVSKVGKAIDRVCFAWMFVYCLL